MAERLVVGISGASGVIYGIRLLEILQPGPLETHLVITKAARVTIHQETSYKVSQVEALAHTCYSPDDIGAALASGSFATRAMVVIPCSAKSLAAIANGFDSDLLSRAADVTLKEGRPLILVVREAPLHLGHLRAMTQAAEAGAVIFPPVPAFYTHPKSLEDLIDQTVGRVLSRLGIENPYAKTWNGMSSGS
ncbi:MAG: UbiX family flavin prenyltransferase [Anaerolineales bacterium]|jgi:4-hydroxy-3-polyprenylbenzoate decarboxylase